MHIFIVYAHPSEESFTKKILTQFINGLEESGDTYEISDLYMMKFCSDMSVSEYKRESMFNTGLPIPEDVSMEHEKLNRADAIVFIYPIWWSDCPAKLKGWFDRVYTVGFAYGNESFQSKIKVKKGLVICTAGHTKEHLEEVGIAHSMRKIMLYDRLQNVGIEEVNMQILGGNGSQLNRNNNLQMAFNFGKNFSKQ